MRVPAPRDGTRATPALAALAVAVAVAVPLALAGSADALAASSDAQQPSARAVKACKAAKNRVAQHQKVLADDDARIERERRARFACGSQKACRRYDQRIESLQERRAEHEGRMMRLQEAEQKACSAA